MIELIIEISLPNFSARRVNFLVRCEYLKTPLFVPIQIIESPTSEKHLILLIKQKLLVVYVTD